MKAVTLLELLHWPLECWVGRYKISNFSLFRAFSRIFRLYNHQKLLSHCYNSHIFTIQILKRWIVNAVEVSKVHSLYLMKVDIKLFCAIRDLKFKMMISTFFTKIDARYQLQTKNNHIWNGKYQSKILLHLKFTNRL